MKRFWFRKILLLAFLVLAQASVASANNAPVNFWGGYYHAKLVKQDITKPVVGRSYFTTEVEPIQDGAKLAVEIYHGFLNVPVSLYLQVAINDGRGKVHPISFATLSDGIADNSTNYYSKREFLLNYDDLNRSLQKALPRGFEHLKIEPGTPLFVFANFDFRNNSNGSHQWGSVGRGGIFFMPEDGKKLLTNGSTLNLRRPTELDLAFPITTEMALKYNNLEDANMPGVKVNGQIRSRKESEGKYQILSKDLENIRKQLFDIANDPQQAEKIFGKEWMITAEMRYMKKDASGNLILDSKGLPTPDPMVDTYYDNKNMDAAKNDMAIRYRWTEGNATGAWNFKPGLSNSSSDGIVDRIEFGVDTTDDKPETIKKFADSMDPLNPFRMIREVVPGSTPSDFLNPSVKITDTRYKFKLQHTSGLVVEVSLDDVLAESLRNKQSKPARFTQLEMDIDHLGTVSANTTTGATSLNSSGMAFAGLYGELTKVEHDFLNSLNNKEAFLDGRPVLHSASDLEANSPLNQKNKADFDLAAEAIRNLRDAVLGKNWIPGAQKNSYAAVALGLVNEKDASKSVKETLAKENELLSNKPPRVISAGISRCGSAFN